jgi:HAMP domain-containing protein
MKLLLKFNLVFIAVFLVGLVAVGTAVRSLLEAHAREEAVQHARLLIEKAAAVRAYTAAQIAPLLETQMKYGFLPQSVPAFSATEVLARLQKAYPDYSYKEATLNPTNPRDRALAWEADVIGEFKKAPERKEFVGQRDTPTGLALTIARPIRINDANCLRCHSTVDAAPRSLVDKYGQANGFGWQLHEVVGAQMVSVPMAVPLARAHDTWLHVMALFGAAFIATGVLLNGLLWAMVIRPVTRMAALAERVSLGEVDAPAFDHKASRDEIGLLATAFTRMRRSLAKAVSMLEAST